MTECHFGFGHLTTKTFAHLARLYSATKEHNTLTKLTFEATESLARGLCHRLLGENGTNSTHSSSKSDLSFCYDSLLEQLKAIEMRHPILTKGSSYTLAISKQILKEVLSISEPGEEQNSTYAAERIRDFAMRTLLSLNEAMEKCEVSDCALEGKGFVVLCEVAKTLSGDIWDITTKEIFSYDPSELMQMTLEGVYNKYNLLKENTAVQVKNLTASTFNTITSVPGRLVDIGKNCMPDLITNNPLTTTSVEYLGGFIDKVKNSPVVFAASEGLSHFTEYISVTWPILINEAFDLPEINLVLVDEDDFHFVPQLPGRRQRFIVFIGQK